MPNDVPPIGTQVPSESGLSTLEQRLAAVLKMTPQEAAIKAANGVCAAYAAYNNGANGPVVLSGYQNFNPIMVYEEAPNGWPFGVAEAANPMLRGVPAAYTGPTCIGPSPVGTPKKGYQLFGFTANAKDGSHNLLAFRGTVTLEEALADLIGWGTNTACLLPSQSWSQNNYGLVNESLYDFYVGSDLDTETSLAESCLNAIQATTQQTPGPWLIAGHSLGGALVTLAALDAVASQAFTASSSNVFTFGSLHVGDASFANAYSQTGPITFRIANLCDFVPSMVSLEPVIPTDPYVHVGLPGTFIWQTWDDWGNHSLANIYIPMVQNYWNIIKWGPRNYPQ